MIVGEKKVCYENGVYLLCLLKGLGDHTLRITALTVNPLLGRDWGPWVKTWLCAWPRVTLDQLPNLSRRQFLYLHSTQHLHLRDAGSQKQGLVLTLKCMPTSLWFHYEIQSRPFLPLRSLGGTGPFPAFLVSGFLGHEMAVSFGLTHLRRSLCLQALGTGTWGVFHFHSFPGDPGQAGWPVGDASGLRHRCLLGRMVLGGAPLLWLLESKFPAEAPEELGTLPRRPAAQLAVPRANEITQQDERYGRGRVGSGSRCMLPPALTQPTFPCPPVSPRCLPFVHAAPLHVE